MDKWIRDVLMRRSRIAIDIIMSLLLVLQMLYLLVGEAYHEWAGLTLTVLLIIHNAFNRRWYKVIFKGRYTKRRILSTAINSACAISIIALAVSGISMARHSMAAPLLPMGVARILHMAAARYGKIAISILAIMGFAAFIKERFLSYMFLMEEFVFFDFSTPLPLLVVEYALIMLLFMFIGAALSVALSQSRKE